MPGQDQSKTDTEVEATGPTHDHHVVPIEDAPIEPLVDTEGEAQEEDVVEEQPLEIDPSNRFASSFDWFALGIVLLISVIFALSARLNPQPPTSLTPAAVLSATGCGLLVTAIRKLRTSRRPGLKEAALGGLLLALCQFSAAITYPSVLYTLSRLPDERQGFLTTWGLIAGFSVVFSIVGASLGHLAFAPLRPIPVRSNGHFASRRSAAEDDGEEALQVMPTRPVASYFVAVLLFGLAPMVVGYVFSAAFDYSLGINHFFGGPYPTLRLLSATLPWQLPVSIDVSGNDPTTMLILLVQLWRIPLLLGNPTMFDVQALEPFVFNGAALALLLLTVRDQLHQAEQRNQSAMMRRSFEPPSWSVYLLLEVLLGLLLVAPADLWIVRGLQGVLQEPVIVLQIRTLFILDQPTFILNLVTGPILCLCIGLLLRISSRRLTRETVKSGVIETS